MNSQKIILTNKLEELARIASFIDAFSSVWNIHKNIVNKINLAIEEMFLNIIEYGYNDKNQHLISMEFVLNNDFLTIIVINDAEYFDIINYPSPNLNVELKDKEIGGLGIFFIKKIVSNLTIENINGINIIHLTIDLNKHNLN
jgi:anti-sigma regulatory factor (Ser/Thr protein kinase)